ncbi:MAG: Methylated-DNA--protein-cysteine methyltransferase, inducible [Bacteroidota bacterium]|jgi:methylated-DNA-[protein]-cysteine S-methyltransferase
MVNTIAIQYFKCKYGELIIGCFEEQLVLCDWRYRRMRQAIDARVQKFCNSTYQEHATALHTETIAQLEAYITKQLTVFDLPLLLAGSPFQQKVWQALLQVPYGKTSTYMQQANVLGDAKAIRAVATANGANAISIIVPCHRIIGSDGSMVGYAGGTNVKKQLLALEGASIQAELF